MEPVYRLKQWASRYMDRRHGLDTAEQVPLGEVGPRDRFTYDPSRWSALRAALPRGDVTNDDVFLDLGSGKGRVVLQAALRYPFKRVIGVERSPELNAIAAENLRAVRHRLRCPDVELVTADALEWDIPPDITIVYMYNPFRGEVFSRVIERLVDVVDSRGRGLRIIYMNPQDHERLMGTGRVVEVAPPSALLMRVAGLPRRLVRRYELRPGPGRG
jgi:SAM-dependent methyltransferase